MPEDIYTDICIVGSGFCGYTAYKKLKDDYRVVVIEGGKVKTPENANEQPNYKVVKNKYAGKPGSKNRRNYVSNNLSPSTQRKYTLGGSSECWSGLTKPFEKTTYENYFQNSPKQNWKGVNLNKYEVESLEILNSPIIEFDPKEIAKSLNFTLPKLTNGLYYTVYTWGEEILRLKEYWLDKATDKAEDIINNKKDVLYGYKLIDGSIENNKMSFCIFKNESGPDLKIYAKYFILGMGGIENARFVSKISNSKPNLIDKKDIGNFQEHPHLYFYAHFKKGRRSLPKILYKQIDISKSNYGINKGKVKIATVAWDGPGTPKAAIAIRDLREEGDTFYSKIKRFIGKIIGISFYGDYVVHMRCEQSRDDTSTISFEKEETSLNWQISNNNFEYYSEYLRRFASFLISNEFAKEFILYQEENGRYAFPEGAWGGGHHMGTVPYTTDNKIIDQNFRCSSIKNTYIVGTSSFPTSGYENPTHAAICTTLAAVEHLTKDYRS